MDFARTGTCRACAVNGLVVSAATMTRGTIRCIAAYAGGAHRAPPFLVRVQPQKEAEFAALRTANRRVEPPSRKAFGVPKNNQSRASTVRVCRKILSASTVFSNTLTHWVTTLLVCRIFCVPTPTLNARRISRTGRRNHVSYPDQDLQEDSAMGSIDAFL